MQFSSLKHNSDIMSIDTSYDDVMIKSNNFDKTFSFEQPFNKETIEYLEYLYNQNDINDILKLRDYLPVQLFEDVNQTISHFDTDEWKDYSTGSRINRTSRYYTHDSQSEYPDINHNNFENFIKISKNIIQNNLNTTYKKYIENIPLLYTFRKEKDDCIYQVKYKTIYYYKFL